jgi:hypothetical protein
MPAVPTSGRRSKTGSWKIVQNLEPEEAKLRNSKDE